MDFALWLAERILDFDVFQVCQPGKAKKNI